MTREGEDAAGGRRGLPFMAPLFSSLLDILVRLPDPLHISLLPSLAVKIYDNIGYFGEEHFFISILTFLDRKKTTLHSLLFCEHSGHHGPSVQQHSPAGLEGPSNCCGPGQTAPPGLNTAGHVYVRQRL